MKELSTQAQVQVFTREQALWHAAWLISRVREKVAELYGWAVAGETEASAFAAVSLAREIAEDMNEVLVIARIFADIRNFTQSLSAFVEEARLEAARILASKEAQASAGEGVPF